MNQALEWRLACPTAIEISGCFTLSVSGYESSMPQRCRPALLCDAQTARVPNARSHSMTAYALPAMQLFVAIVWVEALLQP
jgi:hypothetical protein